MWERGLRNPSLEMLKRITLVLHCSTDELLQEQEGL